MNSVDISATFERGLDYDGFLDKYAGPNDRRRWEAVHQQVALRDQQRQVLRNFVREMKVLVVAGAWCGDCVNQCPLFDHFAAENPLIRVRFFDRDDDSDLAEQLSICGGKRVPTVLFASEDNFPCGVYGDRTLAKYRDMASGLNGAACSTGIAEEAPLFDRVATEWLEEFERIQWMLRTSGRLRQLHGD